MPAPEPTEKTSGLRVFLCHYNGDKPAVRAFYGRLQAEDLEPWLDEEALLPGQDWDIEIRKAIRAAHAILVFLSHKSVTTEGYVNKEIVEALDVAAEKPEGSIYIIPVLLENCPIPDRLKRWHAVKYYEDAERAYERLIKALRVKAEGFGITVGKSWEEADRDETRHEAAVKASESQPALTLKEIRAFLTALYNLEELRDLCFDLGVDYESLPNASSKAALARELILYVQRKDRLPELVQIVQQSLAEEAERVEAVRLAKEKAELAESQRLVREKAEQERRDREKAARIEAEQQAQLLTVLESTDPQMWQPAAWDLLNRRLQRLQKIEPKPAIDPDYITCVEYQLFLDESREKGGNYSGKYHQPYHWTGFRFSQGQAQAPVTGVSEFDAYAFCEWLTEKSQRKILYRLPRTDEASHYPARRSDIGAWCQDENIRFTLVGVENEIVRNIFREVAKLNNTPSNFPFLYSLSPDFSFYNVYFGTRNLALALDLDLNFDYDSSFGLYVISAISRDFSIVYPLDLSSPRNRNLDLILRLARWFGFQEVFSTVERDRLSKAQTLIGKLKLSSDLFTVRRATLLADLLAIVLAEKSKNFLDWRRAHRQFAAHYAEFAYLGLLMKEAFYQNIDFNKPSSSGLFMEKYNQLDFDSDSAELSSMYWWSTILMAREEGKVPAWEGIRVVQER